MDASNMTHQHIDCPDKPLNFTSFVTRHGGYTELYEVYTIRTSLDRIIRPIWFILGIPGTLISFIVWTRPRMRQCSGVYLASIALVDFVFFFCQILFFLETSWHISTFGNPVICELYSSANMFLQYMSPLLTLAFTAQRYLAICHPYASDRLSSTSRSLRITLALTLSSASVASVQGYFFMYQSENEVFPCSQRPEIIDKHKWENTFYTNWNLISELLIFGAIPIVILLLNICVIRETRRLSHSVPGGVHQPLSNNTGAASNRAATKGGASGPTASATTFMLLCVSFYLICATLPVTICQLLMGGFWVGNQCLEDHEVALDAAWQRHFVYMNVRVVIEALAISHYVAKFYIYIATGKQFRRECSELFLAVFLKP